MSKIFGVGTDIIEVSRVKNALKNESFKKRIYSQKEIKLGKKSKNKHLFYAKRFSAKEAFVKALGTGFRHGINFKDISIINDKKGKPIIHLNQNIKEILKNKIKLKNFKTYVSLSDEKKYSVAFVVINKI